MVKLFATHHTFDHPFERVSAAFWSKYPNDAAPHVRAIDIVNRRIDQEGRLITSRIMSGQAVLPAWLRAIGLPQSCYVVETSVVDPHSRRMVVKSVNVSGSSLVSVEETCTYAPCPTAPTTSTLYTQEARITAFLPFGSGKLESFLAANMAKKSRASTDVVEQLCQRSQAN